MVSARSGTTAFCSIGISFADAVMKTVHATFAFLFSSARCASLGVKIEDIVGRNDDNCGAFSMKVTLPGKCNTRARESI